MKCVQTTQSQKQHLGHWIEGKMIANNFGRSVSTELKLFKTMDSCSMADWSRQDSSSKFRYEGKFSSAWFDISKSKTTPGSSYMYRYDQCRSLISCLSAFLCLFFSQAAWREGVQTILNSIRHKHQKNDFRH